MDTLSIITAVAAILSAIAACIGPCAVIFALFIVDLCKLIIKDRISPPSPMLPITTDSLLVCKFVPNGEAQL